MNMNGLNDLTARIMAPTFICTGGHFLSDSESILEQNEMG